MASFQAKIGRERPRKREKKNVPMSSYPTRNRSDKFLPNRNKKFQKNSKKIQKIKKHRYGFFSSQKRLGMADKEKK